MAENTKAETKDLKVPPKFKFLEGEKVLCFHGPLIYEAKCLSTRHNKESKAAEYLIHYSGWKKSWDDWVSESRVLKLNDANLQKQKDLQSARQYEPKNKKNKGRSSIRGVSESDSGPSAPVQKTIKKEKDEEKDNKKPKSVAKNVSFAANTRSSSKDSATSVPKKNRILRTKVRKGKQQKDLEDQLLPKVELKVKIPDELKPWLVDDWDMISRQRKMVNLPAKVTVDQILDDYVKQKTSSESNTPDLGSVIIDFTDGIRDYFNVMLGNRLLYRFERLQYAQMLADHPDTPMSKVYGAEHLLRLFAKMDTVPVTMPLDEKTVLVLRSYLQDFLKFLHKNAATYFNLDNYGVASADYQRLIFANLP